MDSSPEVVYGFGKVTAQTDYVVSKAGYVYARRAYRGRVTARNPMWKLVKDSDPMFKYCRDHVGWVDLPRPGANKRDHYGDF